MIMAKIKIMSKYDFVLDVRNIDESTLTVPDLVLSMSEIYHKYVVTGGDIRLLPGKVRPIVHDDGDEFEDTFEGEENVDYKLRAKELREEVSERAKRASVKKSDDDEKKEDSHDDEERSDEEEENSDE